VKLFPTKNAPRAYFTKLDRVKSGSMTAPEEVLLHREVNKEAVNQESCAWFRVTSVVDDY